MENLAVWLLYGMMALLGFCFLTLLLDMFVPGWDRDRDRDRDND